jgi:hypothetical protein
VLVVEKEILFLFMSNIFLACCGTQILIRFVSLAFSLADFIHFCGSYLSKPTACKPAFRTSLLASESSRVESSRVGSSSQSVRCWCCPFVPPLIAFVVDEDISRRHVQQSLRQLGALLTFQVRQVPKTKNATIHLLLVKRQKQLCPLRRRSHGP